MWQLVSENWQFWAGAAWIALSFRTLGPDQIGAIFFLGWPLKEVGPGPKFVPFLLCWIKIFPSTTIQLELPDEPEEVQKGDQDNIQPGKKAPLRITQADATSAFFYQESGSKKFWKDFNPKEQEAILADPLNHRLTGEPAVIVRYRLIKGRLFQFIKNIGSVEEANRQISDTVVASLQSELAPITLGNALVNLPLLNNMLYEEVEVLTGERDHPKTGKKNDAPWGIDLQSTQLKLIDPGKTVNESMSKAAAAVKTKQEAILVAEGKGAARRIEGEGEAAGVAAMKAATSDDDGRFVAALRANVEISKEADFIIAQTPFDLVASSSKLLEAINKK